MAGPEGLQIRRYWALESRPHEDGYEETVEKVRHLLEGAIRRQLVSDVPLCTFLSGGWTPPSLPRWPPGLSGAGAGAPGDLLL